MFSTKENDFDWLEMDKFVCCCFCMLFVSRQSEFYANKYLSVHANPIWLLYTCVVCITIETENYIGMKTPVNHYLWEKTKQTKTISLYCVLAYSFELYSKHTFFLFLFFHFKLECQALYSTHIHITLTQLLFFWT